MSGDLPAPSRPDLVDTPKGRRRKPWIIMAVILGIAVAGLITAFVIQEQIAVHQNHIALAQASVIKTLRTELGSSRQTASSRDAAAQQLQGEIASLQGQVSDLKSHAANLQTELDAAEVASKQAQDDAKKAYARALTAVKGQLASQTAALAARERAVARQEQAVKREQGALERSSFGDGLFQVGPDIKAGTYYAAGGGNCYWADLRSSNEGNIIDNHLGPGPQTVQISGPFFESQHCGTWVPR